MASQKPDIQGLPSMLQRAKSFNVKAQLFRQKQNKGLSYKHQKLQYESVVPKS